MSSDKRAVAVFLSIFGSVGTKSGHHIVVYYPDFNVHITDHSGFLGSDNSAEDRRYQESLTRTARRIGFEFSLLRREPSPLLRGLHWFLAVSFVH